MFFSQVHGDRNWETERENEMLVFDGQEFRMERWKDLEIHDNDDYTTMWM